MFLVLYVTVWERRVQTAGRQPKAAAERGASHPAASLGPCEELVLLGQRKAPSKTQDPNPEATLFCRAAAHQRDSLGFNSVAEQKLKTKRYISRFIAIFSLAPGQTL